MVAVLEPTSDEVGVELFQQILDSLKSFQAESYIDIALGHLRVALGAIGNLHPSITWQTRNGGDGYGVVGVRCDFVAIPEKEIYAHS